MEEFSQSLQCCKSMAGMFQSVLTDCRLLHPGIEDFLDKTKKLETQLQSTIVTFSSFNESLKGLAEKTNNHRTGMEWILILENFYCPVKGSSSDIKEWLLEVMGHNDLMNRLLIELTR